MARAEIKSKIITVVGGKWGDEGKGKIIDILSGKANVVIRAQGGDNAGHSVENPRGKFALHLVPSGIFNPDCLNVLGAGVALNLDSLLIEMLDLQAKGISTEKLIIDPRANLILGYHAFIDKLRERRLGKKKIGTTGKGIGPDYEDRAARLGIRAGDLRDPEMALEGIAKSLKEKRRMVSHPNRYPELDADFYRDKVYDWQSLFNDRIRETSQIYETYLAQGSTILIEGAQGTLLDRDQGFYPYVTSSNTTTNGLLTGAGLPYCNEVESIGVMKAFESRVGSGAFPTEFSGEDEQRGDELRVQAHEYGVTSGRDRRLGYFDAVLAAYAQRINGFSGIIINRFDNLADFSPLKICSDYEVNGQRMNEFPTSNAELARCKPVYESQDHMMPWGDLSNVRDQKDLPFGVNDYIARISELAKVPVLAVGVGAGRDGLVWLNS